VEKKGQKGECKDGKEGAGKGKRRERGGPPFMDPIRRWS